MSRDTDWTIGQSIRAVRGFNISRALTCGKEVQLMRDLNYRFVNDSSAMMLTIKSRNL